VGSCYGALLSGKNDVTSDRKAAPRRRGKLGRLVVDGDLKGRFHLNAATSVSDIPANSLVLLTTKAQDAANACAALRPSLRSDTVLLALQNGLGIKELVAGAVAGKEGSPGAWS
jgi:ketopantoate reductase